MPRDRVPLSLSISGSTAQLHGQEQVLREGTEDDIRHFIDVDVLEKLWDAIVAPEFESRGRRGFGVTVAPTWRAERASAARRSR